MKTLRLFPDEKKPELIYGGEAGKRKKARPLYKKRPIHLILKSRYILVTHSDWIRERIEDYAKRFGIRVYKLAVCGDHLHFAIQIPGREYYKKFIRALTGIIARTMGKGIWSLLPYTRIASWGRDFQNLLAYIQKNEDETQIRRKYEPRKRKKKRKHYDPPATLSPKIPVFEI
jgi:REP element-mobilizing transposase RayT